MLSSLMKEHAAKQQQQREHVDRLRKEALDAVAGYTNSTVNNLNTSVSEAYYNQRKIDAESRALQAKVNKFRQQTAQWLKLVESVRTSLRELGDVQSWAYAMQQDLEIVNDTLELAYSEQQRRLHRNYELQSTGTTPVPADFATRKLSSDVPGDLRTPTGDMLQPLKSASTATFSTASTVSASSASEPNASMTQSQTSSYADGLPETVVPSQSPPV